MRGFIVATAALVAAALSTSLALAGDRTEDVRFKAGASSAKLTSSIKGDASVNYVLKANAGQTLSIRFAPKNGSCYFNLLPPGSMEAIHIGSSEGNDFDGTLSVGGAYTAQVYLMRNAARRNETCKYSISFSITAGGAEQGGAGGGGSGSAINERDMLIACSQSAAGMYGVSDMKIRLANEGQINKATDGYIVNGEADKGAEGVKKFQCRYDQAGSLKDIMAMTADGN